MSGGVEDVAYQALHRQIVGGELEPGARLVEADLVASLGVSRPAVRAVLSRLRYEGLVDREPHRGAQVRRVGVAEAVEIVQARAALEALAAQQAAARATDEELAGLRAVIEEMRERAAAGDLLGYSRGNARFHAGILEASRHGTAQRLVAGLKAQVVRYQFRTILVPGRAAHSLREHEAVLAALERRDGEAAAAAMRAHLGGVVHNLPEAAARLGLD